MSHQIAEFMMYFGFIGATLTILWMIISDIVKDIIRARQRD